MKDSKSQTMRIEYLPGEHRVWSKASQREGMKLGEWVREVLNHEADKSLKAANKANKL
jgi:hypothetical protein